MQRKSFPGFYFIFLPQRLEMLRYSVHLEVSCLMKHKVQLNYPSRSLVCIQLNSFSKCFSIC